MVERVGGKIKLGIASKTSRRPGGATDINQLKLHMFALAHRLLSRFVSLPLFED